MNNAAAQPSLKQRFVDAMQLHVQGRLDAAREAYEALLKECPGQPEILYSLGTIHLQTQQAERAAEYFRQALAASPEESRYLLPLARAYMQSGDRARALESLVKALDIDPNHAEAQTMLYDLCLPEVKEGGMKESSINRLIAAHPQVTGLRAVALQLCRVVNDYKDRIGHLEALHRNGVNEELFYKEYAIMLKDNGYFDRCWELCQEGIRLYPDSLGLRKVRAHMYLSLGQPEKALEEWQWIVAKAPEDHQARAAVGIVKLLMTDGRDGYEEYAAHAFLSKAEFPLRGSMPEWQGEPLKGKHLLVWSSQGMGDVIMYASLLPWILEQGGRVTLAVYPKMVPIFARSFPQIRVILFTNEILRENTESDFQILADQLMRYVLPHYIPSQHPPYLKVDAAYAETLRQKYHALFPAKKRVGISWFTKNPDTFSQRNIPLEQWQPLFALPNVQLVSLQYGDCAAEIEAVNRIFPGAIYTDPEINAFDDPDALAAQMLALDELVSVQNTTVHLGGALGVKTTLLLSAASEWRWGLKHTDSRWYKSVTILRQDKLLDWSPVIECVRDRLAEET